MVSLNVLHIKDQARREVAGFVDASNHTRRRSSCEMKPPAVYEQILAEKDRRASINEERAA